MNWTYSLERLPSKSGLNRHTVQVASEARDPRERITIKLWTNLEAHAVDVTAHDPIVLYAEVKLGHAPIVGANVVAEIHATGQLSHGQQRISRRLISKHNVSDATRRAFTVPGRRFLRALAAFVAV